MCDSTNNPDDDTNPLTPTDGAPSSPGRDNPVTGVCEEIDDDKDQCFENCMMMEWAKPRPKYAIAPLGTDCQEYSSRLVKQCRKQCVK